MKILETKNAPGAIGPYSQGYAVNGFVYTSGQIGLVPATGVLAEGVEAQAEQALQNIQAVLAAAGCTMADVIKTTVFLADIADFGKINEIYAKYFTGETPARSCLQAGALPKGALFEIEVVAYKG